MDFQKQLDRDVDRFLQESELERNGRGHISLGTKIGCTCCGHVGHISKFQISRLAGTGEQTARERYAQLKGKHGLSSKEFVIDLNRLKCRKCSARRATLLSDYETMVLDLEPGPYGLWGEWIPMDVDGEEGSLEDSWAESDFSAAQFEEEEYERKKRYIAEHSGNAGPEIDRLSYVNWQDSEVNGDFEPDEDW